MAEIQYDSKKFINEDGKRDWETEIRYVFNEQLVSSDPTVRAIAREVLTLSKLNEFCFVIAPKIIKKLQESDDPELSKLIYRLWSSVEEGHVCVFAIDKSRQKIYVIEAAGLLNQDEENDSSLGIHELDVGGAYKLFGNLAREQFISREYSKKDSVSEDPQTEREMNSQRLHYLNELVN